MGQTTIYHCGLQVVYKGNFSPKNFTVKYSQNNLHNVYYKNGILQQKIISNYVVSNIKVHIL